MSPTKPAPRRLAAIVLAAGASSRLGEPKQLVRVEGRALVARAADAALASRCDDVVVVVGAAEQAVRKELAGRPLRVVACAGFREGIAASIRSGVGAALRAEPPAGAVLILLADQLRIDSARVDQLAAAYLDYGHELVASEYAGGLGAPALFAGAHVGALLELRGDQGAKSYLARQAARVRRVPIPDATEDVDTPAHRERLSD